MMDEFTKKFPSLKCLEFIQDDGLYLFAFKDIIEHCVDKQRVRDLITEIKQEITELSELESSEDYSKAVVMREFIDKLRMLIDEQKTELDIDSVSLIPFLYLSEKETQMPMHDALLQIVLGLEHCKTKSDVIELLQDVRALQQRATLRQLKGGDADE